MASSSDREVSFVRLPEISPDEIVAHMSDPRVARYMPLLTSNWDREAVANFVAAKEACWRHDGLGHWAILYNDSYVGWGGFQKEGDEWDYGLVLKAQSFGLGMLVSRKAINFAIADERIPFVTILLPPARKNFGALTKFGAKFVDEVEHTGVKFLKFRVETKNHAAL